MRKFMVVVIIILFTGMSIIPSIGGLIDDVSYDEIDKENPIDIYDKKSSIELRESQSANPPVVEILSPQDGSIIYSRYTNISIVCSDDTGLTSAKIEYGGEHYTVGYGTGINPPCQIYYLNRSMEKIRRGYVWIVARAYDEDGNIGMDTAVIFYNDSNDQDLYPPEINIWKPLEGYIYIFGNSVHHIFRLINYSIVIGRFKILVHIEDPEGHLQKVELYIDNEVVYENEISDDWWEFIDWNCNKFIIGMHEIKIVAIDCSDNSATEELNCFIINFI